MPTFLPEQNFDIIRSVPTNPPFNSKRLLVIPWSFRNYSSNFKFFMKELSGTETRHSIVTPRLLRIILSQALNRAVSSYFSLNSLLSLHRFPVYFKQLVQVSLSSGFIGENKEQSSVLVFTACTSLERYKK